MSQQAKLLATRLFSRTPSPKPLFCVPIERKKLFGFQRVTLAAGASTTVSFELAPAHLAMVDEDGHTGLHRAEFEIVFSRGHGEELLAQAAVELRRTRTARPRASRPSASGGRHCLAVSTWLHIGSFATAAQYTRTDLGYGGLIYSLLLHHCLTPKKAQNSSKSIDADWSSSI